jgi:ribosomal-protein-alanine N-acetyltransferase
MSASNNPDAQYLRRGEPLIVRDLRNEDLTFFRSLAQDKRVVRYVADGQPWTDAYAQQRFDAALSAGYSTEQSLRWFIAETETGDQVGLLALTLRELEIEVGYWISPEHWRRGFATVLVNEAKAIARSRRRSVALVATVDADNVASRRVLESAGFSTDTSAGESSHTPLACRLEFLDDTDDRVSPAHS